MKSLEDITDNKISTDVLVIGAGGAGIRAAIEACDNGTEVLIVCKGKFLKNGSTFYNISPGWGIQFLKPEDRNNNYDDFFQEILEVGEGMVFPELARILVEETPQRIFELEKMGVEFYKPNGDFKRVLACFANKKRYDAAVMDIPNIAEIFRREIEKRNIKKIEDFQVIKIVTQEIGGESKVTGALGLDVNGEPVFIEASAIILACGGGSAIYKYNMNSPELVGDGYNISINAGASLINMEYVQFIFGIVSPSKVHFFEKALSYNPPITNPEGMQFIKNYIPENVQFEKVLRKRMKHGPFTSRNISRYLDIAVYSEMRKARTGEDDGVFLDLSEFPEHISKIEKDFPYMKKWLGWLDKKGIDIEKQKLEIALCAHANNGGVFVGPDTMTEVNGLFACGEIMAGPHGADRQGGNMMAATQVFGKISGEEAAKYSKNIGRGKLKNNDLISEITEFIKSNKDKKVNYSDIKKEIQDIIYEELVICRRENGLKKLITYLEGDLRDRSRSIKIRNSSQLKDFFNLDSMINTALFIANAALLRKESRGSHHRMDFTEKNNYMFKKPIEIKKNEDETSYRFTSITDHFINKSKQEKDQSFGREGFKMSIDA